jgi:hypothetical protein
MRCRKIKQLAAKNEGPILSISCVTRYALISTMGTYRKEASLWMVLDWRGTLVELVQSCMYRRDGDEARVKDNEEGHDTSHDHANNDETLKCVRGRD